MTQISLRAPEQSSTVFDAISSILMGAVVVGIGALSFAVYLMA